MLGGRLSLFEVRDVEGRAAYIIERSGLELSHHEHEDLLAYLIATAWELSKTYDPSLSASPGFSAYLSRTLAQRVNDWHRSRYRTKWQFADRTYERPAITVTSLDQLGSAIPEGSMEDALHRTADGLRPLTQGDSQGPRQDEGLGRSRARRAA